MTNETNGQAIITVQQLQKKHACDEQVVLFKQIWGERLDVTEEEFRKHAARFDWSWGAGNLLPREPKRYRDTPDSWYGTWQDRWTDAAQSSYDAYKTLRVERCKQADATDTSAKYDEVWNSFDQAIDAANVTKEKERIEWQAVWFARLYREACGITTDEWQLKEKANGAEDVKVGESANVVEDDSGDISTSGNFAAAPVSAVDGTREGSGEEV